MKLRKRHQKYKRWRRETVWWFYVTQFRPNLKRAADYYTDASVLTGELGHIEGFRFVEAR